MRTFFRWVWMLGFVVFLFMEPGCERSQVAVAVTFAFLADAALGYRE